MDIEEARSVLGVAESFTEDELHTAYRKACKAAHPDAGGSATDFHDVKAAYDLLKHVQTGPQTIPRFRRDCPTCGGHGTIVLTSGRLGSGGLRKRCPACNGEGLL